MEKDFDKWNEIKKRVHQKELSPLYHAREIWWCSLGVNVGFEQDGSGEEYRRPVVILKALRRCRQMPFLLQSPNFGYDFAKIFCQIPCICLKIFASSRSKFEDFVAKAHLATASLSRQTCFVIPLTAANRDHPMRPLIGLVGGKEARVLLSQMRVIDSKRLVRKIGYLNKNIFEQIRKYAKDLL